MTKCDEFSQDPGAELMAAVGRGEASAFDAVVTRYRSQVLNTLYRFVGRSDSAEDLCQEVFLRVYRARERYEASAKFTTWLFRITQNIAMNHLEYQKHRSALSIHGTSEDGRDVEIEDSVQLNPSDITAKIELDAIVKKAVLSLGAKQRMATIYSKYHGLSYEEISEIMGLKVEAVKSLLFRAREKLREELTPYMGQEVKK